MMCTRWFRTGATDASAPQTRSSLLPPPGPSVAVQLEDDFGGASENQLTRRLHRMAPGVGKHVVAAVRRQHVVKESDAAAA